MAKKFRKTAAHEAVHTFHIFQTIQDGIFHLTNVLRGKITRLEWLKPAKGLSEVIHIEFNDDSSIKLTKFIKDNGNVNCSIKIVTS